MKNSDIHKTVRGWDHDTSGSVCLESKKPKKKKIYI
jgi:hypothetical protein